MGRRDTGLPTDPGTPRTIDVGPVTGQVLAGRYQLGARLGAGGMGVVFQAFDRELGEEIALKVLPPEALADGDALERFRREVKLARKIVHPGICRTFDLGEAGGLRFLTMQLVEGRTLRALLREGQLRPARALALWRQILEAVAAAHAEGVVHRDLKPENIVVRADDRVVVLDFGLARDTLRDRTATAVAGTPGYMAPEQLRGESAGLSCDVFACALIGHELLGGQPAFGDGAPALVASAILRDAPRALEVEGLDPTVAGALAAVVAQALEKRPEDRQASAIDLAAAVALACDGVAPPRRARPADRKAQPRRMRLFAWVLGACALGAGGAVLLTLRPRAAPGHPVLVVPALGNATGEPAWDALGRAAGETLRGALGDLPPLEVVEAPAGQGGEVVRARRASYLLDGRITRVGAALRLSARLSDAGGAPIGEPVEVDTAPAEAATALDALRTRTHDEVRLALRDRERRARAEAGTRSATARQRLLRYYDVVGPAPGPEHLDLGARLLDEALAADGDYVPARVDRGTLLLLRASARNEPADLRAGLADVRHALARAPGDAEAHVLLCRALQFELEFDGSPTDARIAAALDACAAAMKADPRSGHVRVVLGRLLDRRCDDDRAMEALERALPLEPALAGRALHLLVGIALQNGRLEVAERMSAQLVAFEADEARRGPRALSHRLGLPPTRGAHLARAGVLLRLGRKPEALAELRAELATISSGLGDEWAEAAALRGLLRLLPADASAPAQRARLADLERAFEAQVAREATLADRVSSAYAWTDPAAAIAWLDRAGAVASCDDALGRAIVYRSLDDRGRMERALTGCKPTQGWERACVAWLRR